MNFLVIKLISSVLILFSISTYSAVTQQKLVNFYKFESPVLGKSNQTYVKLYFKIEPGYHIQANQVNDENLIPSVLAINSTEELEFGKPVFPHYEEFKLNGTKESIWVFSEILEIWVPVKIKGESNQEFFSTTAVFSYQACDSKRCFFPAEIEFQLKINRTAEAVNTFYADN